MSPAERYDVIVVGAGPAGSTAARTVAASGASVLLLEKDRDIGVPVRCAEAVGKEGIEKILGYAVKREWIADEISRFKFVAPDGKAVYPKINMTGYVLHRRQFDYDLAVAAAQAGARVMTNAYVSDLVRSENYVTGVNCRINGRKYQIAADIVIGADGVESRVGRWAGLNMTIPVRDMETCSQVTVHHSGIEPGMCQFYFSQEDFPGGYGWVFPKGGQTANIGLGIAGNLVKKRTADERLQDFLDRYFPGAAVLSRTVGGVPCANRPERISGNGVMLVGDAAFQSNPMTGGGITSGMAGAKIAGEVAVRAVAEKNFSADFFKQYESEWDRIGGGNQKIYFRIKEGIKKLTDEQLNKTAASIARVPVEKQTLLRIFQTALSKQPSLLVHLIRLLSPFS